MGAGGDGPLGGMAGMEPHHMNGSIGGEMKVLIVSKFVKYYKKYDDLVICVVFVLVLPLSGSGDMDSLPKVRTYKYTLSFLLHRTLDLVGL